MATLTNTQISVTYVGLLKTSANTVLSSTAQQITDGSGNNSIIFLSTAGVGIGGAAASGKELDVTGNVLITGDLQVDNINIDGNTISSTAGTDLNITPLAGQQIVLDGTIVIDAGVVTGATSITSTAFVGALTGDVTGNADTATKIASITNSNIVQLTSSQTLTNKTIDVDNNTVSNIEVDNLKSGVLDTDLSSVSSSDDTLASAKAIKTYVDAQVDTADTLSEILAIGNTTGATKISVNNTSSGIDFIDDAKARFGTGNDLSIYHGSSNSFIQNTSGSLIIEQASGAIALRPKTGENGVLIVEDGAVSLYHNNIEKLTTTTNGIYVKQDNGTPYINLRRDDSTIAAADDIGYINFEGDDPSDGTFNTGARILAQAEGNWSADHYISSLIFQTRATCANLATVLTLASNKSATFAGDVKIEEASTPTLELVDTTNNYNLLIRHNNTNAIFDTHASSYYEFKIGNSQKLLIDNSGNATFAGKILVGTGATAAASLNAYTQTVSSNLFSALRVIENSGASSYWDIGATGGSSTLLNFYHNGNTTAKISFTHTGGATFAGQIQKTSASTGVTEGDIVINTTGGSGAGRLIFKDAGTARANVAYSHDNDNLELIAQKSDGGFKVFTGGLNERLGISSSGTATFAGNVNISGGNVQIGSGHNTASAGNAVIFASYGSGTNIAGGELQLYGGRSTGSAAGGSIKFYTSPTGSSGSGTNSHIQALSIDSSQNATFAGTLDSSQNATFGLLEGQ
jgi:hypothetical protein